MAELKPCPFCGCEMQLKQVEMADRYICMSVVPIDETAVMELYGREGKA